MVASAFRILSLIRIRAYLPHPFSRRRLFAVLIIGLRSVTRLQRETQFLIVREVPLSKEARYRLIYFLQDSALAVLIAAFAPRAMVNSHRVASYPISHAVKGREYLRFWFFAAFSVFSGGQYSLVTFLYRSCHTVIRRGERVLFAY